MVDGLEHPWGLAFLPDGRMLVTERPGRLRIVADGWLVPEPVAGVPEVWDDGQGGLLDVALHPGFAENGLIYLSYASPDDDNDAATAVARGRLVGARLEDVEEIYVALPRDDGGRHFGSRLLFADGYLFVTAGERGEPDRAQDVGDPAGSVIRLLDDGGVPEDNPFVGTGGRPARALLHRPPQSARHGARGCDGANLRRGTRAEGRGRAEPDRAGVNYGWPVITYGKSYMGFKIGEGTHKEGMAQPVHYWVPSISPSGLTIYDADRFPAWQGSFFAGALSGELLVRLEVADGKAVVEERMLEDLEERIRDVRQGPDGLIYLLTDHPEGMLLRLEPAD